MTPTELAHSISLWVPLLSHYKPGGDQLDPDRIAQHARAIRQNVRGFLLAGSTGDGWDMDDIMFDQILTLAERRDAFDSSTALIFGSLRATTDQVIARAKRVEAWAAEGRAAGTVVGHTICPPIQADADQAAILAHYHAVLDATTLPIAVYQLPQVVQCTIEAATLKTLTDTGRVILFKDTSGEDAVSKAGFKDKRVYMLRGAEGGYAQALKPGGDYDGWLLSTANAFGPWLADIARLNETDTAAANDLSDRVSNVVATLFEEAAKVPFANPFSNANRAADHIIANGQHWRDVPAPIAITGDYLPRSLLARADEGIGLLGPLPPMGYMGGGAL